MKNQNSNKKNKQHSAILRFFVFLLSMIAWFTIRILFASCRKYTFGNDLFHRTIHKNKGKLLTATWHRSAIYSLYFFQNLKAAFILSRSRDGELVRPLFHWLGYYTTRGSSGKGKRGKEALIEFISYINKGNIGGIAVDGPQGPPYISKHGIIVAGSRTGAPILPHVWFAEPNIRINTWDKTIIPKPFSKIVMVFDNRLMNVPKDLNKKQVNEYTKELNNRMLALTYQADNWFKLCDKYNDPRDIPVPDPVPIPK